LITNFQDIHIRKLSVNLITNVLTVLYSLHNCTWNVLLKVLVKVWDILFIAGLGKSIANTFFMKYRYWYWL